MLVYGNTPQNKFYHMHTAKVNVNFIQKAAFSEAAFCTKVLTSSLRIHVYFVHLYYGQNPNKKTAFPRRLF
jgi:hypothetical protein